MATKLIHAVTVSESLGFMNGQLRFLKSKGFQPKMLSAFGDGFDEYQKSEGVEMLELDMERGIALGADLRSLVRCVALLRKERPTIVNASTPKAGLVVTLAARLCGVPIRVYTLRGLRMETTSGWKRHLLLSMEKLAASSATHCLAVSDSLKERAIDFGIVDTNKIRVLGKGSGDGFQVAKFHKNNELAAEALDLRQRFGFQEHHIVLGFVGRLTKDKGIHELIDSFGQLSRLYPELRLLMVGDYEEDDPVDWQVKQEIDANPYIVKTGFLPDPVPYYHAMDIFMFLTKREGFGNVSIEAALCGLPVIAANVTGAKNTIADGETGFLVDPNNSDDIIEKTLVLIESPALRTWFGETGREWASTHFSQTVLWSELDNFYKSCMAETLLLAGELN